MKINSNTFNDDTTYLNTTNDIPNYTWFSSGKQKNVISAYYADDNPFNKLNIKNAILNMSIFLYGTFYPLSFDICQPSHIFKSIRGSNETFYRYGTFEITQINCTYDKNSSNQVNVLVLSTSSYRYTDLNFYGRFYTNLKFHYHP